MLAQPGYQGFALPGLCLIRDYGTGRGRLYFFLLFLAHASLPYIWIMQGVGNRTRNSCIVPTTNQGRRLVLLLRDDRDGISQLLSKVFTNVHDSLIAPTSSVSFEKSTADSAGFSVDELHPE